MCRIVRGSALVRGSAHIVSIISYRSYHIIPCVWRAALALATCCFNYYMMTPPSVTSRDSWMAVRKVS